jgi:hypothetical protein
VTDPAPQAGKPIETAFLDANVIRGQLTNDILLSLAEREMFEPRWSQTVLDEMRRNRPTGVSEERIDRRIAAMNGFFPRAMTRGHEGLMPEMQADEKDKHVLAAAVYSRSAVLVTDNVKDFDPPSTGPYAMRVERLSQFLVRKLQDRPDVVVPAMQSMVDRNQRDPRSMQALIDKMASMPELRGFAHELAKNLPSDPDVEQPGTSDVQKQASAAFEGLTPADRAIATPQTSQQRQRPTDQTDRDRGPEL